MQGTALYNFMNNISDAVVPSPPKQCRDVVEWYVKKHIIFGLASLHLAWTDNVREYRCLEPDGKFHHYVSPKEAVQGYSKYNQGIRFSERHLKALHKLSTHNKPIIQKSQTVCGCFYCGSFFLGTQISEWVDITGTTALCPLCGIDTVLPGQMIKLSPEMLNQMSNKWFAKCTLNKAVKQQENKFQSILAKLSKSDKIFLSKIDNLSYQIENSIITDKDRKKILAKRVRNG